MFQGTISAPSLPTPAGRRPWALNACRRCRSGRPVSPAVVVVTVGVVVVVVQFVVVASRATRPLSMSSRSQAVCRRRTAVCSTSQLVMLQRLVLVLVMFPDDQVSQLHLLQSSQLLRLWLADGAQIPCLWLADDSQIYRLWLADDAQIWRAAESTETPAETRDSVAMTSPAMTSATWSSAAMEEKLLEDCAWSCVDERRWWEDESLPAKSPANVCRLTPYIDL